MDENGDGKTRRTDQERRGEGSRAAADNGDHPSCQDK
jgi:hypothetical protein